MVLHFLDKKRGQKFIITRKLRGVAASPIEKPRPQPSKPPPLEKSSDRTMRRSQKKGGAAQRVGDALILLG